MSPQVCVERFLLSQRERDWQAMVSFLADSYLSVKYAIFHEHCTDEAARRYGFTDADDARSVSTREFVVRMFISSERDAEGSNPGHNVIPENADCHLTQQGDEVIVTLSTCWACSRTRYLTALDKTGKRVIIDSTSAHNMHL